jgi:hypothetical protein
MSALAAKATSLRTQVRVARGGYADALAAVAAGGDNQELVTAEARVNLVSSRVHALARQVEAAVTQGEDAAVRAHLTTLAGQLARIRKQEQGAQTRAAAGQAFAEQIGRERDDAVVAYIFRFLAALLVAYMAYKIEA